MQQWSAEHVAAVTVTAAVATLLAAGARWGDAWAGPVPRGRAYFATHAGAIAAACPPVFAERRVP